MIGLLVPLPGAPVETQTGRDFPITEAMAESVAVIRVDAETWSAKSRPLAQ